MPMTNERIRQDEEVRHNILDQLGWDNRVDSSRIQVKVRDGIVTLEGEVPAHSARLAAEADCWAIQGVADVFNRLTISVPESGAMTDDEVLAHRLMNILQWHQDIDSQKISLEMDHGVVTMKGTTEAYWKKYLAESLIAPISGVLGVENRLAVVPTENVTDQVIAEDLVASLERNGHVDANNLDVQVRDGVVTLTGQVHSRLVRQTAFETARNTLGVKNIRDEMTLVQTQ